MSYNPIFVVISRLSSVTIRAEIISAVVTQYHNLPNLATETQSSSPGSGPSSIIFELDCGYHLYFFYENI